MPRILSSWINDDFLDFKTPESCYVLGLLHADGNITKDYIGLTLVSTDGANVFPTLQKCGSWLKYERHRHNWQPSTDYRINSRLLVKSFNELFDFQNKSNKFSIDFLSTISYRQMFVRGFFDGDGCWYINRKNHLRQFSVSAHFNFDWSTIVPLLPNLNYTINHAGASKKHKSSQIRIANKDGVKQLYEYVYQDFPEIGINRKRLSANKCYEYCCI